MLEMQNLKSHISAWETSAVRERRNSFGQPRYLHRSCSVQAKWAPLRFWDTQRFWQSSCDSSPAVSPGVQKPMTDAQIYHILGSQQQYAVFLLQKETTDEKDFRGVVWIHHPVHPEQTQPLLPGVNAAKTHCACNAPLPDKTAGPCYCHLIIKLVAPSLCSIQHYAAAPGEGWRRHGACRGCGTRWWHEVGGEEDPTWSCRVRAGFSVWLALLFLGFKHVCHWGQCTELRLAGHSCSQHWLARSHTMTWQRRNPTQGDTFLPHTPGLAGMPAAKNLSPAWQGHQGSSAGAGLIHPS